MGQGFLTNDQKERLAHYLRQRQANDRMIVLLQDVKDRNDLKRGGVTVAQNAQYEKIVESLDTALKENWLQRGELVEVLDETELAGRQHVLLYRIPLTKIVDLATTLAAPSNQRKKVADLEEYWEVPETSFARVLRNDADAVIVKLVASRIYHTLETLETTADFDLFKKHHHIERSAFIVKLNKKERLLQFRVPPREHGGGDTPKKVFEFAKTLIENHFDGNDVFPCTKEFAIGDAIPKIIANRTDFTLEHDTPEDLEVKTSMSRRRSADGKMVDLRDSSVWKFGKGYSRKTIRGSWSLNGGEIYTHINLDMLQLDSKTKLNVARLFIPGRCSDDGTDHVIRRVQEHIG